MHLSSWPFRSIQVFLAPALALMVFAGAACDDDESDPVGSPRVTDASPRDCTRIGCPGASVSFSVPDYIARFGADSQTIDISSCYGTTCASSRVTLSGASSSTTPTGTGDAAVTAITQNAALQVTLNVPTDSTAEGVVREVSLKIVTSTGRGLVDYKTSAAVETYCPNGLACGPICRRIRVELDKADGGQPVDGPAQSSGGMGRKCEQEPAPGGDASADVVDAPVEKAAFCSSCAADELCVVFHGGVCGSEQPTCRKKTATCTAPACSEACNRDLCSTNSTCFAAPCPQTALYPQALHCYGP